MKPTFLIKYKTPLIALAILFVAILWGFLTYKTPGQPVLSQTEDSIPIVRITKTNEKTSQVKAPLVKPKNGIVKSYEGANGSIDEIFTYKNDTLEGKYEHFGYDALGKHYYKDYEGYYSKNKKTGIWKSYEYYYDPRAHTVGDKLITIKLETYKNDDLNGKTVDYDFKYGFKLIESNFINGIENGIRKNYCPHGKDRGKPYFFDEVVNGQVVRSYNYQCKCDQHTFETY